MYIHKDQLKEHSNFAQGIKFESNKKSTLDLIRIIKETAKSLKHNAERYIKAIRHEFLTWLERDELLYLQVFPSVLQKSILVGASQENLAVSNLCN